MTFRGRFNFLSKFSSVITRLFKYFPNNQPAELPKPAHKKIIVAIPSIVTNKIKTNFMISNFKSQIKMAIILVKYKPVITPRKNPK